MTDVPVVNVSLFEPGFNQDPYPVLEQIRSAGPVVYNEALDRWMVTSYQNVSRALGDATRYAQAVHEAFVDFFGGPTMVRGFRPSFFCAFACVRRMTDVS